MAAPAVSRRAASAWRRLALLPALALVLGALWLFSAAPAEAQSPVWSATLTVADNQTGGVYLGCSNQKSGAECSSASVLSDDDFVFGGETFRIDAITLTQFPSIPSIHGDFELTFTSDVRTALDTLKFCVGSNAFSFSSATHGSQNAVEFGLTSLTWLVGETVSLSIVPTSSSCQTTASGSLPTSLTLSANGAPREGGNTVIVRAVLDRPAPDGLQVNVNLGGTATWGSDYRTPGFSATPEAPTVQAVELLKIPAGRTSASFAIEVVDDAHEDSGETIEIRADAYQIIDFTATVTPSQHALCLSGTCQVPASWMKHLGVSDTLTLTIENHEDAETEAARLAAEAAAEAERQRLAAARAAAGGPLSGLALTAGSQAVALVPAFSPGVLSYRAEVPAGTTGVSLAPSWGALAELGGSPTVWARSHGPAAILAQGKVDASGTAAALALSSAGPTRLEVTVLEPDGSGKPLQGTTTTYRVDVVGAAVPEEEKPQTVAVAFSNVPPEHDGQTPFTLDVQSGSKPAPEAFTVTHGTVMRAWSLDPVLWRVRVAPKSWKGVKIALGEASARVRGPALIRVKDARAKEGKDASLDFAVTLNRAASGPVSVDYATKDGTAAAGADYTAASGTLTFAAGETAKTVSVALLDDAHDEGKETFKLKLSNPRGAYLRGIHREAKGTIRNEDPLQRDWLARFGRTAAADAVAAVTARLETPRSAGSHLTVGGQRLSLGGRALAEALTGFARRYGAQAPADGLHERRGRPVTGRELLMGTSFRAVLGGGGSRFTGWGSGASVSRFTSAAPGLSLSGEAATGAAGMDYERGRLLTGLAMTHSLGKGAAQGSGRSYAMGSSVTTVLPYARFEFSERVSAWSLAGTGSGRLTLDLDDDAAARHGADLSMTLAAAGVRGEVVRAAGAGGFSLALKADAYWVRTESERVSVPGVGNLAAARADASRLRAVLDGSRAFTLGGGGTLTPSVELGVRHDGGEGGSGTGMEVGAGVGWADPSRGLDVAVRVRGLAAHAGEGYREWGVSGWLRVVPGAAGRGLSMSLTPSWGADPGGSERLWAMPEASRLAANDDAAPSGRLDAEVGYGMAVLGGRFTGTPNLGFGVSDTAREYRMGWRLASVASGFELSLDATRRETPDGDGPPEHGVMLGGTVRW